MTRERLPALWRAWLLTLLLSGLFAMHGLGAGHQMPMSPAAMHVISAIAGGHPNSTATAMTLVPPTSIAPPAGAAMAMDVCVAMLTTTLLLALTTSAVRRRGRGTAAPARAQGPARPRAPRPKRVALPLAQLCVLRT